MTTRDEFVNGLRLRLNDISTTSPRWGDEELAAHLEDAVRDYSKYFPRKREQQFVADGTSWAYDLPEDLLDNQIMRVALVKDGVSLEQVPERMLRLRYSTRYWEIIGTQIEFGWVPTLNLTLIVTYNAIHELPESGDSTIPYEDEDLIYLYAQAAAWQRIGGNDAALSRWNDEKKRDDSPLIPHYVRLWSRYNDLVRQKQGHPRFYQRVRKKGQWRY